MSDNNSDTREGDRIAKVIARAGICSRRAAENLIFNGCVKVDGVVIDNPAIKVTASNKIMVNDKPLPHKEQTRLWMFHKPRGCLTTNKDPDGRATIFEIMPKSLPRVVTVGRLDYNSEGLLLLTNDGEFARHMELPASGWKRKYRARAYGSINMRTLEEIKQGATIEGIKYEPAEIEIEKSTGDNFWLNVTVTEGKNREVRKLLFYIGLEVSRLIRTEYGPFKLGAIHRGAVEEVKGLVYNKGASFEIVAPKIEPTPPVPTVIKRATRTPINKARPRNSSKLSNTPRRRKDDK